MASGTGGRKARGGAKLSTGRVVFLVIAAAAPMAAMVGNVPLAIRYGDGAGLPAVYLIALAVLLCFSVGYAAMSRRVVNTGAFYTYIARALGKPAGVAAAYVAVVAYVALTIGMVGAFGYFSSLVLASSGVGLPWYLYSALALVLVAILGYRSVDLSAKVLGALIAAEFAVLVVFDALAVGHRGAASFPAASFSGAHVLSGSIGIALMFAFFSFIGFESAALYGEETSDPERSIPRATYIAVTSIGLFYVLTCWIVVGAAGPDQVVRLTREQGGEFVFVLLQQYGGGPLHDMAAVLMCTSLLAGLLALHNASSRYLFALGREGVLPRLLGRYHPRHFSPHVASAVVSILSVLATGVAASSGADPYAVWVPAFIGVGTLGIVALQAGASVAVVAFFWHRSDRDLWRCVIAPAIGAVGLTTAFVLALLNYPTLTDSTDPAVNASPAVLCAAALAGTVVALLMRRRRPATYAALAQSKVRSRRRSTTAETVAYTRRYCLVGAGPAGLVMARALIAEGVPFDWFERHSDVGGVWDMDNPGSPMYDSAHFISSKYTSGFIGFPMPGHYPDYPSWQQIRDYIRDFAGAFGLYEHVTLGVAVTRAQPLPGDRWEVCLSTGETRTYDGLIAAPGVTWHPHTPDLPGAGSYTGDLRHSATFRGGAELRGKRVLVVGAGNSGVDIAVNAAVQAEKAFLSLRRGYRFVPKHIYGLPTDAVLAGVLDPPRGVSLPDDPAQLVDSLVGDLTRLGLPAPDHELLTTHPIMNTQVLHHLAHGDLTAKPDVTRLTPTGAVFADGTEEQADVILLATGYRYLLPFLDPALLTWKDDHPQLYLNIFSRELDSLYVLGLVEFAGGAYARFDEMAQTVLIDIRARETGVHRAAFIALKKNDQPDLRGGVAYVDSPRHTSYVNMATYVSYLADLRDRFEWADLDERTYQPLRSHAARAGSPKAGAAS
ncbi:amino acid permease [Streptomyces sp. NPDC056224]|uniref:amino acid permease n=1 Tax=Streptomyces sp. NPDC056224 TaxID=3345750 RepID=UPI0035E0B41F